MTPSSNEKHESESSPGSGANAFFFRVEHDLLRSESFKALGGSAIKVYLIIGLYSDFGTDWAYPSIRTIARQAGLSRQTVLAAVEELTRQGLLVASKSPGRSTAYKIIRQAPPARRPPRGQIRALPEPIPGSGSRSDSNARPGSTARSKRRPGAGTGDQAGKGAKEASQSSDDPPETGLFSLVDPLETVPESLEPTPWSGPFSWPVAAQGFGPAGPGSGPKREPASKEEDDTTSIPIPGTPFRLTAQGRVVVAVDLQELLTSQGIPGRLAQRLISQKDPEAVAKVLLNAFYLQSQGKLQNGPGYIRAGIEDGYDLLPQVASRLEGRRRELEERLRQIEARRRQQSEAEARSAEEAAIAYVLEHLDVEELDRLLSQAVSELPAPIVRRNPTLSNPFVRAKVYELACGEPLG
jgi:hypothetical protein